MVDFEGGEGSEAQKFQAWGIESFDFTNIVGRHFDFLTFEVEVGSDLVFVQFGSCFFTDFFSSAFELFVVDCVDAF